MGYYNAPPPPPGYYGYPPPQAQSNGLAIAGLVCGIVGAPIFQFILGPLAIIFGGVALGKATRAGAPHKGMSCWAIALGIVDIAIFVALLMSAIHDAEPIFIR